MRLRLKGIDLSAGTVASVLIVVLGLWVVPWFSAEADDPGADRTALQALASDHAYIPMGEVRVKLWETEICQDLGMVCGTALTPEVVDGVSATAVIVTLAAGCLFCLLLLEADHRRMSGHAGRWWRIGLGGAVGLLAIAATATCLVSFASNGIHYVIEEPADRFNHFRTVGHEGYTDAPTRAQGGFVALAGLALGLGMLWRTRPERADAAAEDTDAAPPERARPPRDGLPPPPRGVETDPFRSPPAPPPIVVTQQAPAPRAAAVPRAQSDADEPGPRLLR